MTDLTTATGLPFVEGDVLGLTQVTEAYTASDVLGRAPDPRVLFDKADVESTSGIKLHVMSNHNGRIRSYVFEWSSGLWSTPTARRRNRQRMARVRLARQRRSR